MHSRIIQLSKEPIDKDDYITEDTFIDDFVGVIADYVSEETDREEDIKWLLYAIKEYGIVYNDKEESIIFPKGFKENYFRERFKELKEVVQNISLEQFASNSTVAYNLASLIEDKHGFYIYTSFWQSFDSFVRGELEEGEKYYIGGTIDYHF